jgi:hypothetical protein
MTVAIPSKLLAAEERREDRLASASTAEFVDRSHPRTYAEHIQRGHGPREEA